MTRSPRSTSIIVLRYETISPFACKSSDFGRPEKGTSKPKPPKKTKRTGPEKSEPVRLWGRCLLKPLRLPVFLNSRLGRNVNSEPIEDLVGPEALEAMQRLVQRREFLVRDAADLFHGLDVLLIERIDDAADFLALRGQANANRTAIDARTLMVEEAEFDQLLQIIGDVGAEIVTARAQFARGQLLVADIIEQQRLHRIDIGTATTIEFILDDIEQAAMQPLHQRQSFEIERLNRALPRAAPDGFRRRCNGFHHDTSPVVVLSTYSTKLLSRLIAAT